MLRVVGVWHQFVMFALSEEFGFVCGGLGDGGEDEIEGETGVP